MTKFCMMARGYVWDFYFFLNLNITLLLLSYVHEDSRVFGRREHVHSYCQNISESVYFSTAKTYFARALVLKAKRAQRYGILYTKNGSTLKLAQLKMGSAVEKLFLWIECLYEYLFVFKKN